MLRKLKRIRKKEKLSGAEELASSFKVKNPVDPVKLRECVEAHNERV